jgi:polysaccharide transporter, PST family
VIVNFIVSIIRVKIYAVFLGPAGLGVISQFTTFLGLVNSTVHAGTPLGLSAILPGLYKDGDSDSKQKIFSYFKYFSKVFSFVALLVSFIIIVFSNNITILLLDDNEHSIILTIVALSVPFTVLYGIFESFLRSSGQINKMVKVSIYSSLISLPLLLIFVQILNLNGVAIYLLLGGIIPFVFMLSLFNKVFSSEYRLNQIKLNKQDKSNVLKTGITSLLAFLYFQAVILYLRKFIILHFGFESNGLYQSVLGLSYTIFAFLYSFLGNHTLTQLSMVKENDKIIPIIDDTAKFLIFVSVPIIILLFGFRELVFVIFYSKSFILASNLILFQLIGDFFRIFASLFSLWFYSRIKIKQLIFIDTIFNALLLCFPYIFISIYPNDLRILPFSYMLASFIQLTLFFIYTKKKLNFKFSFKTSRILLVSVITISFSLIVSSFFVNLGYFIVWIILFIWGFIILKYIELIPFKATIKKLYQKYRQSDE